MFVNTSSAVIGCFPDGMCLHELRELRLSFTDITNGDGFGQTVLASTRYGFHRWKNIPEKDLVEFVHEVRYLEQVRVTYGTRELVTPYVRSLLPQTNAAVLHQRTIYRDEVQNAPFFV